MIDLAKLIAEIDSISVNSLDNLRKKFSLLEEGINAISPEDFQLNSNSIDLIVEFTKKIYVFGYEIGTDKAFEFFASDFHKPLVINAVQKIKKTQNPDKRFSFILRAAMVYEYDSDKRKDLEQFILQFER